MFVIAGTSSGVGKTTVTLGLLEALRRRGLHVQPFKSGPDYIDAGLHSEVLGRPSYNLDTWMMGTGGVKKTFLRAAAGADLAVVEGVMGLFDGRGSGCEGSTAHIASTLGLPIVLVVDARSMSTSVAAVVKGFMELDPTLSFAGVILNRVGSKRHATILREAIESRTTARVLGTIPRDEGLVFPSRHLGLFTGAELDEERKKDFIEKAARAIEEHVDLDLLIRALPDKVDIFGEGADAPDKGVEGKRVKIAVARDEAFSFYYQENLDILENCGADIEFFSPLRDDHLPFGTEGIFIGGGYPELYASKLEGNIKLRSEIIAAIEKGMPLYAECGGLIYLGSEVKVADGGHFEMAGVFPWRARMLEKRRSLGYREVAMLASSPFLPEGGSVRGHEYHYSEITEPESDIERVYDLGEGAREGYLRKNALASYIHLHFASNPAFAEGFVGLCRSR